MSAQTSLWVHNLGLKFYRLQAHTKYTWVITDRESFRRSSIWQPEYQDIPLTHHLAWHK